MSDTMRLSDFLTEIGRPVAYFPSLAKCFGINVAIFVCQMAYWKDKGSDPDGWIYKTSEELTDETGLSYYEQKTARDKLKGLDALEEKYKRLDHTMYYRIKWDKINELWCNWRIQVNSIPQSGKTSLGNDTLPDSLNESYTTTETTTENTSRKKAKVNLSKSDISWTVLAGEAVTEEQIARLQSEQSLLDEYERAMGYNPLPWTSPKLDKLRQFLITKSAEEIQTFAAWSRRPYSSFSPAKARSYPEQVKDNWPQAFMVERELTFAERLARA